MTREQVAQLAERLRRAEAEYQAAQLEHDGSDRATERYRDACHELLTCDRIARAILAKSGDDQARQEAQAAAGPHP